MASFGMLNREDVYAGPPPEDLDKQSDGQRKYGVFFGAEVPKDDQDAFLKAYFLKGSNLTIFQVGKDEGLEFFGPQATLTELGVPVPSEEIATGFVQCHSVNLSPKREFIIHSYRPDERQRVQRLGIFP